MGTGLGRGGYIHAANAERKGNKRLAYQMDCGRVENGIFWRGNNGTGMGLLYYYVIGKGFVQ